MASTRSRVNPFPFALLALSRYERVLFSREHSKIDRKHFLRCEFDGQPQQTSWTRRYTANEKMVSYVKNTVVAQLLT